MQIEKGENVYAAQVWTSLLRKTYLLVANKQFNDIIVLKLKQFIFERWQHFSNRFFVGINLFLFLTTIEITSILVFMYEIYLWMCIML